MRVYVTVGDQCSCPHQCMADRVTNVLLLTDHTTPLLIRYIKGCKLYTRLHTKKTDRHMYLNYFSEHPISLIRSIPYLQCLRLKRIHSEPQYLLEAQIHMYLFFIWREYPHDVVMRAWMKTNRVTGEQLLTPMQNNQDKDIPLIFISTYSRANPNFKDLFFQTLALFRQIKCH